MLVSFVSFDSALLLSLVLATRHVAIMPNDIDVVNVSLVRLDAASFEE